MQQRCLRTIHPRYLPCKHLQMIRQNLMDAWLPIYIRPCIRVPRFLHPVGSYMIGETVLSTETNELEEAAPVLIYPNPVGSSGEMNCLRCDHHDYRIFNISGKLWKTRKIQHSKTDISFFPPGVYLLHIVENE